ncbi:MAG: YqhA family protein [Prevotellaceae bacterium]|jgi:uncharacterized membrane protein YqhA|nr:YqhA family protein [Prevotellaceae bacterium]
MNSLNELKEKIFAGGVIDKEIVEQIRTLLSDNGINRENANILFEIKDACLSKNNDASWETFFINAITSYLLDDDASPGHIDDDEAQWLRAKIQHDGKLSKIDKALLANLKKKSVNFPEILHYKSMHVLFLEAILYGSRFVTFLAVLGSLTASVVLFILSTIRVINGLIFSFDAIKSLDPQNIEKIIAIFVSSIDGYLFSTVLLIFGMGIYELFINKIDIVNKGKDSRPNWLMIGSIDDLKSSLGKVILMILIVSFFEHSLDIHYKNISDLLFLGIGILLIAVALFLTHTGGKHKDKKEEKTHS